jgi:hypothetical protein
VSWKEKVAWPFIWLEKFAMPLMKWITTKIDRWLDK